MNRCTGCGKPRPLDYEWLEGCCDEICLRASQQTPKPYEYRDKNTTAYIFEKYRPHHVFNKPEECSYDE